MSKVYLALKDNLNPIFNILKQNPQFSEKEIITLLTLDEIEVALQQKFDVFITSSEYINKEKIDMEKVSGIFWIIDNTGKLSSKNKKVKYFHKITDLMKFIPISNLGNQVINESITEKQTQPPLNEKEQKKQHFDIKIKQDSSVEQNKTTVLEEEPNLSNPIPMDDYPQNILNENKKVIQNSYDARLEKAIDIRKKVFSQAEWERNKTIGVWAPLHRTGVTTFIVNFAIFLQKYNIPTTVIETPNNHQRLKSLLTRYKPISADWHSFIETLYSTNDIPSEKVKWVYRGVRWSPLGSNDFDSEKYSWDEDTISLYFNSVKPSDLVLADFPTGNMKQYTLNCLEHLNELWILIDDDYDETLGWKPYIHKLIMDHHVTAKLIFNKTYSFSRTKEISEELEIPLIAAIPQVYEQSHKNKYENKPLIDNYEVQQKLQSQFHILSEEVLGKDYKEKYKGDFWHRMKKYLQLG